MESYQLIKGAGDIGSAVAHRLRRAGLRPVLCEASRPVVARRRMSFAPVLFGEEVQLEGLRGMLCSDMPAALACLAREDCVPVLSWPGAGQSAEAVSAGQPPAVVVDARMRKREQPPVQIDEAPLVIGIGPGFAAGKQVHAVIESGWGDDLGRVIWRGEALAYTGRSREVSGHGRERYVYAPHEGIFRTSLDVLSMVEPGQEVGHVVGQGAGQSGSTPLAVTIGGILRGLAHDGIEVRAGAKLVEVDPRGEARHCIGIAERPARIATGVLRAIGDANHGIPG